MESYILSIGTSLISGLIGVLVGFWITNHTEKRQEKISIMKILITNIQLPNNPERVAALNVIPVVFYKEQEICKAFDTYKMAQSDVLSNINTPTFQEKLDALNTSYIKLIELMAQKLRYKATITWDKLKNPYTPKWYRGIDSNIYYY